MKFDNGISLKNGDILQIIGTPSIEENNHVKWHLMDKENNIGFVTARPEQIVPEPAAENDETVSELVFVDKVENKTTLILKESLKNVYDRTTVSINCNIARATHGETVKEVLGSGDGSKANQSFVLKKPPLTYVSSPTPSGAKSTLEVRVDDVLWKEASSLYGLDERSQNYMVRIDDDGKTTITFGDGKSGSRLSPGIENVTATYRSGIGFDGEVDAGSLTLLQNRPPGIRSVTNPIPASGSEPPEKLSNARHNAPNTVLTFDRIVSLKDFESFARSFAGIGKAQARVLTRGQSRVLLITIAASNGSEVDGKSIKNLCDAIDDVRDPTSTDCIEVKNFQLRTFSIEASIIVDPQHIYEEVRAQIEAALRHEFSFENRGLGQSVTSAEILTVMQSVEGVIAVVLKEMEWDELGNTASSQRDSTASKNNGKPHSNHLNQLHPSVPLTAILESKPARLEDGVILPAQLLLLNPKTEGLHLEEMKK